MAYPKIIRKVAESTISPEIAGYVLCADGNVWYYCHTIKGNEGPLDRFRARVEAGRLKARMID